MEYCLTYSCQFVSLRKEGIRFSLIEQGLIHFGNELRDFADTEAFVSCLDLVISVCTSIGDLAGALNKPTWLLLSLAACWRWFLERNDSPWYPKARLFRQPKLGDWTSVIELAAFELVRFE